MLFRTCDRERRLPTALARLATLRGITALLLLATAASAAPLTPGEGCNPSLSWFWRVTVGENLFFNACGSYWDCQLWRTDGTNTVQLSNIVPTDPYDACARRLTEVDGRVFFETGGWFTIDPRNGGTFGNDYQLWVSDGTSEGTVPVTDSGEVTSSSSDWIGMAGHLFFTAWDGASKELWKSDGTASGTVPLTSFRWWKGSDYSSSTLWNLMTFNGTLLFSRCQADRGCELWKSDGTAAGTVRVAAAITPPWEEPDQDYNWALVQFTRLDDRLFFQACRGYGHTPLNCELWRSDGSQAGTVRVTHFHPGIPIDQDRLGWADHSEMAAANERVFFRSCQPDAGGEITPGTSCRSLAEAHECGWSCGLWTSDGTPEGTVEVLGDSWPEDIWSDGGELLVRFLDDPNIWTSDGTAAGTMPLVSGSLPTTTSTTAASTSSTSTTTSTVTPDSTTSTTNSTAVPLSTTSTTTIRVSVSTTSTTLTCSSDAGALCDDADPCTVDLCDAGRCRHELRPGLAGARCRLRHQAPSLACEDGMPDRLEHRLDRARRLVKRAADASDQQEARRLIGRAERHLEAAARMVARSAQDGMAPACADALERAIAEARAGMNGWLARDGGR